MLQAIINGVAEGAIYAILAVGLVFINKITEVANFAQGEIAMVAAFVSFSVIQTTGVPLIVALVVATAAGAALGYGLERFAIRPVLGAGVLGTTVVTLGLYYILHGGALVIWGPDVHPFPSFFGTESISIGGVLISPQHLAIMVTSLVTAIGLSAFLQYTGIGLAMRAVPQNRFGASLIGLDLRQIFGLTWMMGAAVSAVAGFLLAPVIFLNTNMMLAPLIKAFAAAVLGGLDSLLGAFVGGILLGVVENVVVLYLPSQMKDSLAFLFIIIVLLVRPEGLLGRRRMEKV
jgi:branched-chain amino acid transport system permease protein